MKSDMIHIFKWEINLPHDEVKFRTKLLKSAYFLKNDGLTSFTECTEVFRKASLCLFV